MSFYFQQFTAQLITKFYGTFTSDRINNLSTSQTLCYGCFGKRIKAQGKDIISLSLGEPDFNT
jgi:hypothetical protein